ncbi:acyl-CoA thioesterase [Virgibacillus kekensis]|uniref:Acyl-CoA thioesterase n=1 Tax=Virgibacillus kekensis TaxID=202261 RepID=A0ABV9DN50_9BACI
MSGKWYQKNMRVQYKDTDQMGIAHHGNYVTWFEVGRTEWMREYGMSYHKMEALGLLLPVINVNVDYKKSAKFDDCVAIFSSVANYSPVRLEFAYEARKISEDEFLQESNEGETVEPLGELLARGSTTHMWVKQDWKPAKINKAAPDVYAILQDLGESDQSK